MQYKGLTLDKFQEDAIHAVEKNKSVIVAAPTGSGKTLIADYIIDRDVQTNTRVIYTAPIKALSNQKYKDFINEYGEDKVGLLTGDIVKNPDAPVLIMTTEIFRNMAITQDDRLDGVSYVIFDEIHFINDPERGTIWEESIIFSPEHIRLLCLSATIPNADELRDWIHAIKEHPVIIVRHDKRNVPLHLHYYDSVLGITTLNAIREHNDIPDYRYIRGKKRKRRPRTEPPSHVDLIRHIKDKTPCFFFTFSRAGCQKKAIELAKADIFKTNKEITKIVLQKLQDAPPEINKLTSVKTLRNILPKGIAFHHAGLVPVMKDLVEDLFAQGLINVLYTTETFAVGINMPAKTVCFDALRKYDGREFRYLNTKEFFQIAGRAGRRGIDKEGHVYIMIDRRDFHYRRIKNITSADTDPIISQFKLSANTVLNMLKNHTEQEIHEILCKSFYSYQQFGEDFGKKVNYRSHNAFDNLAKKLNKLGYLDGRTLTQKGEFAANIHADEILISEIFATDLYTYMNEYQMMLAIATICYEYKDKDDFYKLYPSKDVKQLKHLINSNRYLSKQKLWLNLHNLTALIRPCYQGASVFDILDNTNLVEGDLIRYFRQVIDRIRQIKQATPDKRLADLLDNCQIIIANCLKDIDVL